MAALCWEVTALCVARNAGSTPALSTIGYNQYLQIW